MEWDIHNLLYYYVPFALRDHTKDVDLNNYDVLNFFYNHYTMNLFDKHF
jgi:hypothetical protein